LRRTRLQIMRARESQHLYNRIYKVVRNIPKGRVATYGQVAALAGMPGQARLVGYALHALPEGHDVPWHRVINAKGRISLRTSGGWGGYQRHLLETEGVTFGADGRVPLARFRWKPDCTGCDSPRDSVPKGLSEESA
jgi:methylated-DNA-protein-cysteine methyltransferase-like protein